ncbi:MAG: hypothetical protein EBE86_015805 [Hormoscilla sp. GUM202]|nr:hypothetical protein [Hormoscilla sp. GUM202]
MDCPFGIRDCRLSYIRLSLLYSVAYYMLSCGNLEPLASDAAKTPNPLLSLRITVPDLLRWAISCGCIPIWQ